MRWLRQIFLGSALISAAHAQVVLNFQDLTLADYGDIPDHYGATLDPNLADVSYRTFLFSSGATLTTQLDFWNADYGDLTKVAFATSNGYTAEVSLTPAAGYGIKINSFDMAGWLNQDRTNTVMRLVDGSGNVLYDFASGGAVAIEGDFTGARHSSFAPNISSGGTVRLQWGDDWDIGLDNLNFEVVPLSAIPEPALAPLVLGCVALAGWLRRRGSPKPAGAT
jgi:hypothetical protein